jgi:cytochrome c oxidase subunit 2
MDMLSRIAHSLKSIVSILLLGFVPALAWADDVPQIWSPRPWGLGMQPPGTSISSRIYDFHNILLVIIIGVSVFVLALLVYVCARYNKRANPVPSQTAHNTKLEIIWTAVPCLIVLGIAWISFPLLYYMDRTPAPELTLKVTGHQWYWSYEYPDQNGIAFDSQAIWNSSDVTDAQAAALLKDATPHWLIKNTPLRLLEVDNRVVLPVGKVIRAQITGADVLHSWYIPSLGVNRMAVVGRLNEVWFKIDKPGLYYGQCSMICGNGHGYMPIVIEGVPADQFDAWAKSRKTAALMPPAPRAATQKTASLFE